MLSVPLNYPFALFFRLIQTRRGKLNYALPAVPQTTAKAKFPQEIAQIQLKFLNGKSNNNSSKTSHFCI